MRKEKTSRIHKTKLLRIRFKNGLMFALSLVWNIDLLVCLWIQTRIFRIRNKIWDCGPNTRRYFFSLAYFFFTNRFNNHIYDSKLNRIFIWALYTFFLVERRVASNDIRIILKECHMYTNYNYIIYIFIWWVLIASCIVLVFFVWNSEIFCFFLLPV